MSVPAESQRDHTGAALTFVVCCMLTAATGVASSLATELTTEQRHLYARPTHTSFPAAAPYSPQIATLGKMLFFDPRLSRAQNMSCSSCHNPSFGWETSAITAIGDQNVPLSRHAPTVINLSESKTFFWDGRASSLEEQALGPITNPLEMGMQMETLVERLKATRGYRLWFDELFPGEGVTENNILRSIATFERTLQSGWSDFDDWIAGNDQAISATAKRGFELFTGKAKCSSCHTGWAFTDHGFHDIGLATDDVGRGAIDNSVPLNRHAFKTPTLRNIFLRAPYMHHGELISLEAVLEHYNNGGIRRDSLSPLIRPLGLNDEETREISAFLQTLTENELNVSTPVLPAR